MKEQNNEEKKKTKSHWNKEKRFYLFTAISSAALLATIIVVSAAVGGANQRGEQAENNSSIGQPNSGSDDNEQVVVTPEGMCMPVENVNVLHDYGFYHNSTLGSYYTHSGLDFSATTGDRVLCVDDGVIESVYSGDVLTGTEITVTHADGLQSVYRFVDAADSLKAGDTVKRGQVIGTVAAATGNEYKDGAHLHFEVREHGKVVDPTLYLTLEEK